MKKTQIAATGTIASEQRLDIVSSSQGTVATITIKTAVNLTVPYLSQMPDGLLVKPWSKACEEASIVMISEFYRGNQEKFLSKTVGKEAMNNLISWENNNFGYNDDTNASFTVRIVNEASSFTAYARQNPSLEEIKEELRKNRPVMSLHYGLGLQNPYLHFKADGPVYHLIVLKGFDDEKKEFIAHDPGTYQFSGDDYRYSYETIMSSLHDYDATLKKASGPPVVIFTELHEAT